MEAFSVYKDMQSRTNGEIYIGVVGPVRTGKSTFIKKFMDTTVIPNIEDEAARDRAVDELPQSASGRTIMTTEPKFIPEQAVTVKMDDTAEFKVRLIDCVGFIVPSALGYIEEEQPRMVRTPWFEDPIPFNMAAEIGTQKVITDRACHHDGRKHQRHTARGIRGSGSACHCRIKVHEPPVHCTFKLRLPEYERSPCACKRAFRAL